MNHKIVANFRLKLITSAISTLYYIRNYLTLNFLLLLLSLTLRNDARGVRREQEVNPLSVSHPLVVMAATKLNRACADACLFGYVTPWQVSVFCTQSTKNNAAVLKSLYRNKTRYTSTKNKIFKSSSEIITMGCKWQRWGDNYASIHIVTKFNGKLIIM